MPSTIRIKRSGVLGKVPTTSDIGQGELAINFKDQKLYSSNGTAVFQITGGGSSSNGFSGILVGANVIVADSSTDRLTLTAGSRINLAGNPTTDTITISASTNDYLQVANATTLLAAKASWAGLTATNTALRTLISDRLQVANASTIYQTKAVERAALANTNSSIATQTARITLVNTNLTGTNTALRTLINARLQVSNAATLYATKSNPATSGLLAHTGRATISTNLTVSGNTQTGGVSKVTDIIGLLTVNGRASVQTNFQVNGNTIAGGTFNSYGATTLGLSTTNPTTITGRASVGTNLSVAGNTSITNNLTVNGATTLGDAATDLTTINGRATIAQNLNVSGNTTLGGSLKTVSTTGLLAHTGRATISTNLAVTGNTTIAGLVANGSLGTANRVLKTNGSTVFWGEAGSAGTPVVLTKKNVSALLETDQVVTNVTATAYSNTVVDNSLLFLYATKNSPTFTGTIDDSQAAIRSQTLTDAATITWNTTLGTVATVTLGGNRTISNPTNLRVGTYMLIVKQDATGSRTLTWGTSYKFPAGVKPTLTTTANAIDIISFFCDGTNMFGTYAPNMS